MVENEYKPLQHSIVQALLKPDGWYRYEASDFVIALLLAIHEELKRCYLNAHQESLTSRKDWELLDVGEDFEYRRYWWGDEPELCALPNLKFEGVAFKWYKYPGRGTSTNVDWTEKQWREWFDRALAVVRKYDNCHSLQHMALREQAGGISDEGFGVQQKNCRYCLAGDAA